MPESSSAPIPAATLILIRDRPSAAPELLMVERAAGMAFAGGAMVFPGGRIDAGDHALAADSALITVANDDALEAAARIAAIRETLEETGIPVGFAPTPASAAADQMRKALHESGDFAALLASSGHRLDLAALTLWARWLPNFAHARIFDTLFFIARAPEDAEGQADGGESVAIRWASAADVLADADAGRCDIIFPTRRNLERLAACAGFAAARANAVAHQPVRTITPFVEQRDGVSWLCIPGDAGYPVTEIPLDRDRRA